MIDGHRLGAELARMRAARPLVQCVTNYVAMNVAANAVLAVGASPAMVHSVEEAEDFAAIADALTINIGTLSGPWVEGMRAAIRGAARAGRPWALDPVAVGATAYRTRIAAEFAAAGPTAIRGNASEILALSGEATRGRGVDAGDGVEAAEAAARALARSTGAVVAVTGAVDFVTDGREGWRIAGGDARMLQVTALGCALTAVLGAFLAGAEDPLAATAAALGSFAVAGAAAGRIAAGPGTFQPAFLDALAALEPAGLAAAAEVRAA
jgi:hydroxyethylthiazole kinase